MIFIFMLTICCSQSTSASTIGSIFKSIDKPSLRICINDFQFSQFQSAVDVEVNHWIHNCVNHWADHSINCADIDIHFTVVGHSLLVRQTNLGCVHQWFLFLMLTICCWHQSQSQKFILLVCTNDVQSGRLQSADDIKVNPNIIGIHEPMQPFGLMIYGFHISNVLMSLT